ncbi:MAG TPA: hypothetical protein VH164_00320 [Ktedonobacteraceae bacterium]|nr:hypothetical protein [Ktedonobacteraceae bacterium]
MKETEEELDARIAEYVKEQWALWCARGGLDAVEAQLGQVKAEPWRLGFEAALRQGRQLAEAGVWQIPGQGKS